MRNDPAETPGTALQKTEMSPIDPKDPPSLWEKFLDRVRSIFGGQSVDLARRFAVAKVMQEEANAFKTKAEGMATLLAATANYEKTQAEIAQMQSAAKAEPQESPQPTTEKKRLSPLAQKLLGDEARTVEDLQEEIRRLCLEINIKGGTVEIPLPPEDE